MWSRKHSLRTLISALLAALFVIAVEPGAMAMPSLHHAMSASCSGGACRQMPPEAPGPCKNMTVCAGMLGCYGTAVVTPDILCVPRLTAGLPAVPLHQAVSGLTLTPDDPPPIV